ncbi:MAG: (4Fe-4S)-binding protein [Syntrophomonadaceae bacterium]|jgi:uncharacterized Fe-S cluster protein YjdI|nr:(4Fe-4S)-binding protein [Bacillota bacterium]NLM87665.1 hypothetical protein [Syntrophomonadaceae bacterium]HAA08964.1 hypothetical protein [Syntrophomonas sp.]HQA49911.1 (4Fe-4S)-binding protein [Syntrophomonadaceae bacterium]HQD90587.1 (4Fe-4S)-binding protein [Syntrophomonadaceae bacterium]
MKEYRTKDIVVYWEPDRCSHSAVCLNQLPQVFDLQQKPWVNVAAASPEDIIRTIDNCPSGALKYSLPPGSLVNPDLGNGPGAKDYKTTAAAPSLSIKVIRNGPLVIEGEYELKNVDGSITHQTGKTSLCRCGLSGKRPFCDGTHYRQGWKVDS